MRAHVCWFCLLVARVHSNAIRHRQHGPAEEMRYLVLCSDELVVNYQPECVSFDPCSSTGTIGQHAWHHINSIADWKTPTQTTPPSVMHVHEDSMSHAQVPEGVVLDVSQLNFSSTTANTPDPKTQVNIVGNCTDTRNAGCRVNTNGPRTVAGGAQLFKWAFSPGYSCDTRALAIDQQFSSLMPPNTIVNCKPIPGSEWANGTEACTHECRAHHTANPTLVEYVYFYQYSNKWNGALRSDLGTHDSPVEIFIDTRHLDWRHGAIIVHQFRITCGLDATTVVPIDSPLFTWSGSFHTGGKTGADIFRRMCTGPRDKCTLTVNTSSIAYGKRNCNIQIEGSHYKSRSPWMPVRITSSAPSGWDPMPGTACIECTKPSVAEWTNGSTTCEYECPPDNIQDWLTGQQSCVFECEFFATEHGTKWIASNVGCGSRQSSTSACKTMLTETPAIYNECQDCTYSLDHQSQNSVYTASRHYEKGGYMCMETPCPDHHTGQDGECMPCPVNTQRPNGEASCSACPDWQHTPIDGEECTNCFAAPDTVAVCASGMEKVSDATKIDKYFTDDSTYLDSNLFCKQNYACLPCTPGSFLKSTTCELCSAGKYQPNQAATECFDCGSGTTSLVGSVEQVACVCATGHEG